ncbi:unnamed protein product [Lactuca saligna]|uniref:Bet v I/Major latex protein domain-containing protein n=1 Tax=Lactuca saligna TaxID=75948 RepID=A0AA36EHX8_LACSI|nr:unnamed protein product [Lactuca saligna]
MGLCGKRVAQVDIKCNADVFLGLFRYRPNNLSKIAPDHILGCQLVEGEWGAIGSKVIWNYKIDGKLLSSKQVLEAADEKNKSITYTPLEGDAMLQIYKSLKAHIHFTENGENNFVTWTLEYEKINEDVPDPDALIDLAYKVTKVVELHLLK